MRILHIRPEGHRESHNLSNLSQTFINAYKFYFVLVHDESSIVVEGIRTFFFYERYFNYKPHKQNKLANIQPNIYKKGI